MLDIEHLDVRFPAPDGKGIVHAVADVNLTIEKGEFIAVIGPSGCGKTTLLEVLAGLTMPSSGSARIDGDPIVGPHPEIGVVFQDDSTFPWLTAWQNVEFGLRHRGKPKRDRAGRIAEMLDLVGLRGFEDHLPSQLSGGMRQRLAIARALAPEPKLLLMDEPFGALDEQSRLILGDELLQIWRKTGATILFVTHSLSESVMLADRVLVMSSRPGQVREIIANEIHDRSSSIIGEAAFVSMTARLWRYLEEDATAMLRRSDS